MWTAYKQISHKILILDDDVVRQTCYMPQTTFQNVIILKFRYWRKLGIPLSERIAFCIFVPLKFVVLVFPSLW